MFTQIIGEKKAKEIIQLIVKVAKEQNIELPACEHYLNTGDKYDILMAFSEFQDKRGGNKGGLYFIYHYEASKLWDYVHSLVPSKQQMKLIEKWGLDKIKQFQTDYFPKLYN